MSSIKRRYVLNDVTFLVPVRIDSEERLANLSTIIEFISGNFDSKILVLESDSVQKIKQDILGKYIHHYNHDTDPIYYKTKYVNQLLSMTLTKYAIVWDVDVIAIPAMVYKSVIKMRKQKTLLAYPYDGRVFSVDQVMSNMFRKNLQYEILFNNTNLMSLMHGYYSTGGVYIVDKNDFLKIGGENENFYGWGPEDQERVVRCEILGEKVHFEQGGCLFHLWHPRKTWFYNEEIELNNRKAFLKTCKSDKSNIIQSILWKKQ